MNKKLLTSLVIGGLALVSCKDPNSFDEQWKQFKSLPIHKFYIMGKIKGESRGELASKYSIKMGIKEEAYTIMLETENGFKTFTLYSTSNSTDSVVAMSTLEALLKEGDEVKILLQSRIDGKDKESKFDDLRYVKGGEDLDRWQIQEVNGKRVK